MSLSGEPFDTDVRNNFIRACEYDDFLDFLEEELGREYLKELQEKFDKRD
jgi:hypothetical protein